MPYRQLVMLSYFIQGSHALLSSTHLWFALQGSGPVFNILFTLFNLAAFLSAARWRADLRRHAELAQRRRDFFRR